MLRRSLGMTLFFTASMVLLASSSGWTQPRIPPTCASRPACRPNVCSQWGKCTAVVHGNVVVTRACIRFRCTNYQQKQY